LDHYFRFDGPGDYRIEATYQYRIRYQAGGERGARPL
jgi:hypothetical protein